MTGVVSIKISGLVGIDHAQFEFNGIGLIVGQTGAGKTTIASGVAAALTRQPLLRGIVYKNKLGAALREGHKSAIVEVRTAEGIATVRYPTGEVTTSGAWPEASAQAVGTAPFMSLSASDRSELLSRVLKATPTPQQIAEAMVKADLEPLVAGVVKKLETSSFDEMLKSAQDNGVVFKNQWSGITGRRWGIQAADRWEPDGWNPGLEKIGEEVLKAEVEKAEATLSAARQDAAMSTAERTRLDGEVARIPGLEKEKAAEESKIAEYNDTLASLKGEREGYPPLDEKQMLACPYGCAGKFMAIAGDKIAAVDKSEGHTPEETARMRQEIADITTDIRKTSDSISTSQRRIGQIEAQLAVAKRAKEQLGNAKSEGTTAEELQRLDLALADARLKHTILSKKNAADRQHKAILHTLALIDVLKPEGVRQEVLTVKLAAFNEELAILSKAAGIPDGAVNIDPADMTLQRGKRPFGLLSEGEQLAVDTVMRAGLAAHDGSHMLVVDQVDHLQGPARSGLFRMLATLKIPSLVCCAARDPKGIPDLEKSKVGSTFWATEGTVRPLQEVLAP